MRALQYALFVAVASTIALFGAAGCNGGVAPIGHEEQLLATLPDCSAAQVAAQFQAQPSSIDDVYVVRVGATDVCTTDFSGLEALDARTGDKVKLPPLATADSNPMPGRGTDPADSNPMPGRGDGTDPASSNPMPGHGGTDTVSSNPMPGRNPDQMRVARQLAAAL